MQRYPNMNVEFGARIGELGRQPRASRKFFERFQDRILFGTDLGVGARSLMLGSTDGKPVSDEAIERFEACLTLSGSDERRASHCASVQPLGR